MNDEQRDMFDRLVDEVVESLPRELRELLEQVPVIVDDAPDEGLLDEMGEEDPRDLLGLHSGTPNTEASVEAGAELPPEIRLFRVGIADLALGEVGWAAPDAQDRLREEIRVTLLHEIGHQFGLDEDDLERLGYD